MVAQLRAVFKDGKAVYQEVRTALRLFAALSDVLLASDTCLLRGITLFSSWILNLSVVVPLAAFCHSPPCLEQTCTSSQVICVIWLCNSDCVISLYAVQCVLRLSMYEASLATQRSVYCAMIARTDPAKLKARRKLVQCISDLSGLVNRAPRRFMAARRDHLHAQTTLKVHLILMDRLFFPGCAL